MLINLADYDVRYNDPAAATNNRAIIDNILADIVADAANNDGDGAYVNLGGRDARVAGRRGRLLNDKLWVDLSSGPIRFPTTGDKTLGFVLDGNGGVTLQGTNSVTPTTPVLQSDRTPGGTAIQMVSNCWIKNDSGSGIYIHRGGDGTVIENVVINVQGNGTMDDDDDLSLNDLNTASYGLKIDDTDGARVYGAIFRECKNHAVLVGRWHFGVGDIRVHGADGAGFRGKEVNGCHLHIRTESCGRFGTDIHHSYYGTHNLWHEACRRWSPREPGGPVVLPATDAINLRVRRARYRSCEAITVAGWRNGWRENLVDVDEGTRNAMTITDLLWHEPSDFPIQSGAELTLADVDVTVANNAKHNFLDVWPLPEFRPTITLTNVGSASHELRIDIPAGCYDNTSAAMAYFRPFSGHPWPAGKAGDAYYFSCRVDVDQPAVDHCRDREEQRLQPALGQVQLATGAGGAESRQSFLNFWNTKSRRFGGRIFFTGPSTPIFSIDPFFSSERRTGMGKFHDSNPDYPVHPFQIRISDIKIWYLPDT